MDTSTSPITKSISQFLHRFHVIIFVVVVLGAVGVGIFLTYQHVLSVDDSQGYTAQANNITFDAATREQLMKLKSSTSREPGSPEANEPRGLPIDGRTNPFVE